MLELLTLLGFQWAQAAVDEPHDSGLGDDQPLHPPWPGPLADELLLAELVVFHKAEHC